MGDTVVSNKELIQTIKTVKKLESCENWSFNYKDYYTWSFSYCLVNLIFVREEDY